MHIGAKSSECAVSIFGQEDPNFSPTWTHLAPTSARLGSQDCATWPQVGPMWAQLRPKLKSTWLQNGGHRASPAIFKTRVFTSISNVFGHRWCFVLSDVPMLRFHWDQLELGARLLPKWPKLHHASTSRASHGFNLEWSGARVNVPAWRTWMANPLSWGHSWWSHYIYIYTYMLISHVWGFSSHLIRWRINSCLVWFPWWLRHGAMDPFEGTQLGDCWPSGRPNLQF